jgi:c-di-AMP phosphodiesterase-like protein
MIVISGRSLGSVNVQIILERMGGGGHLTVAGAQLKDTDMKSAAEALKEAIRDYLKEAET